MISALTRRVNRGRASKREAGGHKTVQNNDKARRNVSPKKLSVDMTYFVKYFALVVQGCNCNTEPVIVLLFNCFGVFGGGTLLAMPKTICVPDTSSLKPGSGVLRESWIRGSPGVQAM